MLDSGLRGIREERSRTGIVTEMCACEMVMSGYIVPLVKRGKNVSFSLIFRNTGEEDLNAHAVFKCYKKKGGVLVWEFATTSQKVASNKTAEFVVYMNTSVLLPREYFVESNGRFYRKHVEHTTRVFRKDFMVIR